MIYSKDIKKNAKGFIIKSTRTHLLLNGRIIKLIKYKTLEDKTHFFFKKEGNIHQMYIHNAFFEKHSGSPRELLFKILNYKKILLLRRLRNVAERYFRIFKN